MMSRGVMLGELVTNIGSARAPVNKEMDMMGAILNPIKSHVNGFDYFCLMSSFEKPAALELSARVRVSGWACTISERMVQIGMSSWTLRKVVPI